MTLFGVFDYFHVSHSVNQSRMPTLRGISSRIRKELLTFRCFPVKWSKTAKSITFSTSFKKMTTFSTRMPIHHGAREDSYSSPIQARRRTSQAPQGRQGWSGVSQAGLQWENSGKSGGTGTRTQYPVPGTPPTDPVPGYPTHHPGTHHPAPWRTPLPCPVSRELFARLGFESQSFNIAVSDIRPPHRHHHIAVSDIAMSGCEVQALQGRQGTIAVEGPGPSGPARARLLVLPVLAHLPDVDQCCFSLFCSSPPEMNAMHFRRRPGASLAWDSFLEARLKTAKTALILNR